MKLHSLVGVAAAGILAAGLAYGQNTTDTSSTRESTSTAYTKHHTSAKHDVGSGAGDIGKGAGKGALSAAKGGGKAAVDLVTLHPIDSATDAGKGAVGARKNVGVGAVKGTGKILRGTGKAIKHLF